MNALLHEDGEQIGRDLGRVLQKAIGISLGQKMGFALVLFENWPGGVATLYVSNLERDEMLSILETFVKHEREKG